MNAYSFDGISVCARWKAFSKWPSHVKHSFTPSNRGSKILKQMTIDYKKYLLKCDPKIAIHIPERILTQPSEGVNNDGYDNMNSDLILRQQDMLINYRKNLTYIIDDLLGKGTFGQVVKCHTKETNQLVAIKIIKNSPAFNQQCKIEIEVLRTLSQFIKEQKIEPSYVIQLQDQFVYRKHACLVFPLMAYNLYDVLKHHKYEGFNVKIVRKFLQQIVSGLITSEQCGVVHADLKPENIMIETNNAQIEECNLKIIDYGSSCFLNKKHPYIYIQSRFYRAPEIIMKNEKYTNKIDIWSLGCIAVEILCGTALFPCAEEFSCLERIITVLNPKINQNGYINTSPVRDKYFEVQNGIFKLKSREQFMLENHGQEIKGCFNRIHPIQSLNDLQPYYFGQLDDDHDQPSFYQFLDFIKGCLKWEPNERMSAQDAGYHPFLFAKEQQFDFDILDEILGKLDTKSNPSSSSSFNEDQFD